MGKAVWKLNMEEPATLYAAALRAKNVPYIWCALCDNYHAIEHITGEKHYKVLHRWLDMNPGIQYPEARQKVWQNCLIGGVGGIRLNHLDGSIEVFKGNQVTEELPPFPPAALPWQEGLQTLTTHGSPGPPPPPPPPERPLSDTSGSTSEAPFAELNRTGQFLHRSDLHLHTLKDHIARVTELAMQELKAGRMPILSLQTCSTNRGSPSPQLQQQQLQFTPLPPPPPVVPEQQHELESSQQLEIPEPPSRIMEHDLRDAATTTKANEYVEGDAVMAYWFGSWEPGTIYAASPDGLFTVRWETEEITPDVAADRLRPRSVSNGDMAAGSLRPRSASNASSAEEF